MRAPVRPRTLLIATTNPGKSREIASVLAGLPIEILTLADLAPLTEPEETAETFLGNAAIKARAYAALTGHPTVADDSGLAVDALDGRPGVASARYPGETYPEKFANLYRELAPHARPWTARFVCAVAYVDPAVSIDVPAFTCEAAVEGEIVPAPRGSFGFGYDPIFLYPPYGETFGEVSGERKLAVAHRGKAFRLFREWLETLADVNG